MYTVQYLLGRPITIILNNNHFLNQFCLQATIFVKRTVGELLFEGYADTIMEIADSLNEDEDDFDFDDEEQEKVKMDKFGWFYQVS
jgi:hypothetical protein